MIAHLVKNLVIMTGPLSPMTTMTMEYSHADRVVVLQADELRAPTGN